MSENEIVAEQHAAIGNVTKTDKSNYRRTEHPDAQWFPGSLGLFIHWGISSVSGTGDLSWSMMCTAPGNRNVILEKYGPVALQQKFTPNAYWKQAESFNPDKCNPGKWLSAAKKAGITYAVLTTKHHDGYTMWPSKTSSFGVQTSLPGKDFVCEFIEACRENGLKVGLYYSPPDWYLERERMAFGKTADSSGKEVFVGMDHEPIDKAKLPSVDDKDFVDRWNAQVKGHLYELLTSYGKIDLLWFDGSSKNAVTLEELRKLQPGILFNPRGLGYGDYETPECKFPAQQPSGWWEYCHIWNDGAWGYLKHEIYKPTGWMIGEWAKARAWGGNFLVNVGPDSRGELPPVAYKRFAELAKWNRKLGFAIAKDTVPGPWPEKCNAPATIKGSKWYMLLVFEWDESEIVVKGVNAPKSVRLLRMDSKIKLEWRMDGSDLRIPIRNSDRGVLLDIVEIEFGGR
ncbi:MAG: alpha-L-fucosidase [Victivallales bacterium]